MGKAIAGGKRARSVSARRAAGGIVGKKCWKVAIAFGGELHLHFGAHVVPKMAGKTKGSWRFGTCGTSWTLVTPKGKISSTERDVDDLKAKIRVLEGSKVRGFKVSTIATGILSIAFDNGCVLLVIPTAEDDKHDLPYWELFMPGHRMVTFGPGKRAWWAGPSDKRRG